jgi:hypothetical protein
MTLNFVPKNEASPLFENSLKPEMDYFLLHAQFHALTDLHNGVFEGHEHDLPQTFSTGFERFHKRTWDRKVFL